jgi:predicted ATPase
LAPVNTLLVLDNAEQVLAAVADLVAELLMVCPRLKILVTSRAPLRTRGEQVRIVPPLGVPAAIAQPTLTDIASSPAVRLFVRRAEALLGELPITAANALALATICRRLDGLPLAIELAAARVSTYSLAELAKRLERALPLLTQGPRDLPARQQTLRDTIAWSHDLLTTAEQTLFRRLTIFAGGFIRQAAEQVAGAREGIAALVDQSLLTRTVLPDGSLRFGMLETIREFGREQLEASGEADILGKRHLAWCREMAEQIDAKLFTPEEDVALAHVLQEDANLRAALDWAFTRGDDEDIETALLLAASLTESWYLTGRLSDGRDCLNQAIAASRGRTPSPGVARVFVRAAQIEQSLGAVITAEANATRGLALARDVGDPLTVGRAMVVLGNLATMRGEFTRARTLQEEALGLFRQHGDRSWTTVALLDLGICAYRQGEFERAEFQVEEALASARAAGDAWGTGMALYVLADMARDRGDLCRAGALFREALAISWKRGDQHELADCLSALGAVAVAANELERAARLMGAAESLYRRLGIDVPPPMRTDWPDTVARIRSALDGDHLTRAWATTPAQAAAEVLADECVA